LQAGHLYQKLASSKLLIIVYALGTNRSHHLRICCFLAPVSVVFSTLAHTHRTAKSVSVSGRLQPVVGQGYVCTLFVAG
jgi:hypothetical protein